MKSKLIGLLVLLVFSSTLLIAQIHFGATTAINATAVLDEGLSSDPRYESKITYNVAPIGFAFGIDIGKKFGLSLESIVSKQGQIYEMIDVAKKVQGERNVDLSYLQIPLMMNFMSGGSGGVRGNFNFGPQVDILTKAVETIQAQAGTYTIPEGVSITDIQKEFPSATDNGNGTYDLASNIPSQDVLTKEAGDFANTMFSLAAAFGLNIDLSKNLYLTSQVRANYSLTGMRNADVFKTIASGSAAGLLSNGSTVQVGVQLGLHFMIGGTRSKKE